MNLERTTTFDPTWKWRYSILLHSQKARNASQDRKRGWYWMKRLFEISFYFKVLLNAATLVVLGICAAPFSTNNSCSGRYACLIPVPLHTLLIVENVHLVGCRKYMYVYPCGRIRMLTSSRRFSADTWKGKREYQTTARNAEGVGFRPLTKSGVQQTTTAAE